MSRDPKLILESFRIEEDDPLLEPVSRPVRQPIRKKSTDVNQMSQAAVLSLCLITGLSAGVGSAFAKGDLSPEDSQVDQVPWQADQPQQVKLKPNLPPVDQKKSKSHSNQKNINEDQPMDAVPFQPIQPKEPSNKSTKTPTQPDPTPKNVDQVDRVTDKTKVVDQAPAAHKNFSSVKKQEPTKTKPMNPITQKKYASATKGGSPSTETSTPSTSSKLTPDPKAPSTDSIMPKTEAGGVLPKTAGTDLEGVVLGSASAMLAAWYLMRKKKEQNQ